VAAAIERELGMESALVGGHGGIFEVRLDGDVAYTNGRRGGIPNDDQVLTALRAAMG
jgi:predicted Rdx family selenoprotein